MKNDIAEDFKSIRNYLIEARSCLIETLNNDNNYFLEIEKALDHLSAIYYYIEKYTEVQDG